MARINKLSKAIAIILSGVMLFTGCAQRNDSSSIGTNDVQTSTTTFAEVIDFNNTSIQFDSLSDEDLLTYIEDLVYTETITSLNSDQYFVENVSAIYISNEYLEEIAYNSHSNIYFGYTIAELNNLFDGTKYIFTLGDDGKTKVQEMQIIEEHFANDILKNVAIGTGVILICVTISIVTAAAGAPAISMIFAASAKTGASMAISSAAFGGISAGITEGIQTGDFSKALEASALGASEGFKIGAISGALAGGVIETVKYTNAIKSLKLIELNGITKQQAAAIQMETNLPMDIISQFHSFDEFLIYKDAGLKAMMVNGKTALVQNIDLNFMSELPDGSIVSNLVRMQRGYAPLDPITGKAYQLHHIGQNANGTLAVLTEAQHQGNSAILNIVGKESEIVRAEFATTRKNFWSYMGNVIFANGGI